MIAFRARVYVPKSVDPTETTVLTPRSGAWHSDAFQVATVNGLAGYQPYLDHVSGRAGRIDMLTKGCDMGAVELRLGDIRDPTDTSDAGVRRWLTAYCGDSDGRWQLPACKVAVDRARDWDGTSGTWLPYFTGRTEPATAQGMLLRGVRLIDLGTELEQPVFDAAPHASITYATRARLWPVGLPLDWGNEVAQDPIECEYDDTSEFGTPVTQAFTPVSGAPLAPRIIVKAFADRVGAPGDRVNARFCARPQTGTNAGVTLTVPIYEVLTESAGGVAKAARLFAVDFNHPPAITKGAICDVWIEPAVGEQLSDELPLLIADVHPVQLLQDLLDGKFGQLDATTGDPDFPIAYDPDPFDTGDPTALINDTTLPSLRFVLASREDSLRDFIVKEILAPCNLGYRIDAEGRFVLLDLRQPTATPASVTITDADLIAVTDRAQWEPGDGAVSRLEMTYYVDVVATDAQLRDDAPFPDIPPSRLRPTARRYVKDATTSRGLDFARKPHALTARGLRTTVDEDGGARETIIQQQVTRLGTALDGPFGLGPMFAVLQCGQGYEADGVTLRPAEQVEIGGWVSAAAVGLEDPATCTRDSARLMRVVEVSDEGLVRRLTCLDPGPDPVAGPPNAPTAAGVVGTPTTTSGVVSFTLPLSNMPDFLRPRLDGVTWGADVAVTVGVGAAQSVEFTGLTPGLTYAADCLGVSSTGVVSTSSSPDASLTTSGPSTIPTPTLAGSKAGSVLTLTITPGFGSPSGVTWIVERNGVYFDETTALTYENLVPGGVTNWTVYGTLAGYDDSLDSNTETL